MAKNPYKARPSPGHSGLPRKGAGGWVFIVLALLVAGAVVLVVGRK